MTIKIQNIFILFDIFKVKNRVKCVFDNSILKIGIFNVKKNKNVKKKFKNFMKLDYFMKIILFF